MNPLMEQAIADTPTALIPRLDYNDLPQGAQLTMLPDNGGWSLHIPPAGFAAVAARFVRSPMMWFLLIYALMTNGGWRIVHRVWTGSADPFQLPWHFQIPIAMGVMAAGSGWMAAAWLQGRMETTLQIDNGKITFMRFSPLINKTITRPVADIEKVVSRARYLKIVFRKRPGQRFLIRQAICLPALSSRKNAFAGVAALIEHPCASAHAEAADASV